MLQTQRSQLNTPWRPTAARQSPAARFKAHAQQQPIGLMGLAILFVIVIAHRCEAQGTAVQYERAGRLDEILRGGVLNESVELNWFGDQDRYAWYRSESPGEDESPTTGDASQRSIFVIDTSTGEKIAAAQCEAYLQAFGHGVNDGSGDLATLDRIEASRTVGESTEIVFENRLNQAVQLFWNDMAGKWTPYATIAAGAEHRQHTYAGHVWVMAGNQDRPLAAVRAGSGAGRFTLNEATQPPASSPRRRPRDRQAESASGAESPDGAYRVVIRDHNVVLIATSDLSEQRLTHDGHAENEYRLPVWWAPDSQHFCLFRTEIGERRQVTLVESSPADQLQPKVVSFDYAKPGDRLDRPQLYVWGIDNKSPLTLDSSLAPNPFAVTDVNWREDGQAVRALYNERGHQRLAVLSLDIATGTTRTMIDETSQTFVDYAGKRYLRFLDSSDEAIWMSERSGWNQLYMIRQSTGEVLRPITAGEYVVREVVDLDVQTRTLLVAVGGFYRDQDPYHLHLVRYSLDGSPPVPLTAGDGNHTWEISPNGQHLVVRYSRVDLPPVTEVRSMQTGQIIATVEQADASALVQAAGRLPQRFVAKGRDGQTDIYGMIVFPYDFDERSDQRYPVLEKIYAGPHAAHVPKSFGRFTDMRKTADLGFIVVQIDGMGTSFRSKAFHDVCWQNLADSGFPDRIAWMQAAAKQIPQMDLSRVGIWGGSAGGQNAMRALIDHGDFYHAAFADCGCHDNRMDKIWWNELWMGWPIGPHYESQSNVTGVDRITGQLMLVVGELDRNVDPASTMQVVNALVKADKDFELLLIPGAGHGAGSGAYGDRRRRDFFVRHLWETKPRQ